MPRTTPRSQSSFRLTPGIIKAYAPKPGRATPLQGWNRPTRELIDSEGDPGAIARQE